MLYLMFIFMGFIIMFIKFVFDRYMNYIFISMIVVICIDVYFYYKIDE